jgi:predicted glycosyltransferase
VRDTLLMLKERGARLVLGLRDVMDEPRSLLEEWRRKNVFPALYGLYDEIWVYGLPQIFDPLSELPGMAGLTDKLTFTGYLRRSLPPAPLLPSERELPDEPYVLVTTGGGGDGEELIDWVLSAYELDRSIPHLALLVFGPFMHLDQRCEFQERAARLDKVYTITFDARFEQLVAPAIGVVAMGGYNTFCEILSFGKPALIVPRTAPRQEQYLRAARASRLGLLRMLPDDGVRAPWRMAEQLHALPGWPRPRPAQIPGLLGGLERITECAAPWLDRRKERPLPRSA